MSDAATFTQINEPGFLGPLGAQANPNTLEVNPAGEEEENLLTRTDEARESGDIVELSGEALRLAEAETNGVLTEEVTAGIAETEANAGEEAGNGAPKPTAPNRPRAGDPLR